MNVFMSISEEIVWVKVKTKEEKHYSDLGYIIPQRPSRDLEVRVIDLPKESRTLVTKICDYCNMPSTSKQTYSSILKSRKNVDAKDCCNKCKGIKASETKINNVPIHKSLFTLRPDIAKEWHPTLNDKNATEVSCFSIQVIWWQCPLNQNHVYDMPVAARTNGGSNCPYCSNKRVCIDNCLATTHPLLAQEWHHEKNGDITPYDVCGGSDKKYWWLGECGHEWDASCNKRTSDNTDCPFCSGRRVDLNNCLVATHPDIAKEWHPKLNGTITPYEVTRGTNKYIWWLCNNCDNEWRVQISSRTFFNTGCPRCSSSKGEKTIEKYLKSRSIKFTPQFTLKELKGIGGGLLKFDFAVLDTKDNLCLLIEYDGEFHYHKFYEDDGHETIVIHDKLKNDYCKKNNIPLLRIPYWEFDNIEDILIEELKIII